MPHPIQVFEHQRITTEKGRHAHPLFSQKVYDAFRAYHQSNENTPYFELINEGVRFKQYVGAIQIEKTTIEVLPKAGKWGNERQWQAVLLSMLKKCRLLTARSSGTAQLRLKTNSVLDLYFELFLTELETLFRKGLIKKYRKTSDQQPALKGALKFSEHLSKNLVHKQRFFTTHQTYNKDHLINQLLQEALQVVNKICRNPAITDRIGRLLLDFPETTPIKVQARHFENIKYDRKAKDYQEALGIARLILLNYRPDIRHGAQQMLAIMFDMNVLWEEYIFRILQTHSGEWLASRQNKKTFWQSETRSKGIRPDIVLHHKKTDNCVIIDTKWKVIDSNHPGDDDLKQMYVYNHYWKAKSGILLYPKSANQPDNTGSYLWPLESEPMTCRLGFVTVLDENGLNPNMASEIFDKLSQK